MSLSKQPSRSFISYAISVVSSRNYTSLQTIQYSNASRLLLLQMVTVTMVTVTMVTGSFIYCNLLFCLLLCLHRLYCASVEAVLTMQNTVIMYQIYINILTYLYYNKVVILCHSSSQSIYFSCKSNDYKYYQKLSNLTATFFS